MLRNIVFTAAAVLLLASCSAARDTDTAAPDQSTQAQSAQDFLRSEVRICCGEYEGKGTILAGNGKAEYIVSAAHLLEGFNEKSSVFLLEDRQIRCELAYLDPALDIGILKITGESTGRGAEPCSEGKSPDNVQDPEEVSCAGTGEGSVRSGYIAGRNVTVDGSEGRYLYLMLETEPGMSGSGVYSSSGLYMGTLTASLDDGGCVAVPVETVLAITGSLEEMEND